MDYGNDPWAYYAVGIHPNRVGEYDQNKYTMWENALWQMADEPGVAAIGETGFDFHREPCEMVKEPQEYWFHTLLKLSEKKELPVILHIRNAFEESIEVLKQYSLRQSGVVHCFNRDWNEAKTYLDLNLYLGIGGCVTYPECDGLRDAIRKVPMDRILLETDAPFLKPVGYTKEGSNSSLALPYVIQTIADLKKMSYDEMIEKTTENALRLFKLW